MQTITAKGQAISVLTSDGEDFLSLTDIAKYKSDSPNDVIRNWLRTRDTLEFLGLWESLNNPDFKPVEFDGFRSRAGLNSFTLSPKAWIERVNAKGLISRSGRYGGTFAHSDIAFEFASWVSAEFKLFIIQDYKRLKKDEGERKSQEWQLSRQISKLNYRIHTDAIKSHLLLPDISKAQAAYVYASEADMLNVVMFGMTAKEWKNQNSELPGNMRDYASINQLLILSNLESHNAELLEQGLSQPERMSTLRKIANRQMESLSSIDMQSKLRMLNDS